MKVSRHRAHLFSRHRAHFSFRHPARNEVESQDLAGGLAQNDVANRQRGAVSVEVALLVPVFVLVAAGATAGWRLWWAGGQVHAAAAAAARAASVLDDPQAASQTVVAVVNADLETAGVHCQDVLISQDVAAVALPPGVPGNVRVDVRCTVGLSDLLLPLPGSIAVSGTADEAIDIYSRRGR